MSGPPPPPPFGYPAPLPSEPTTQQRLLLVVAHLGGLIMSFGSVGVLGFAIPLGVYLVWRDSDTFVAANARQALNFQLTILTLATVAVLLSVPAVIIGVLTFGVGIVVLLALAATVVVLWILLPLIAVAHGLKGRVYRYPFTLRYLKG
ncbi:MAG: DUF4870 domain-containing protein [Nitriliruptoraceae bacterium]